MTISTNIILIFVSQIPNSLNNIVNTQRTFAKFLANYLNLAGQTQPADHLVSNLRSLSISLASYL